MNEARGRLRNRTETENDTESEIVNGIEIGKGTESETGSGMTGGTETEESRGERTWHRSAEAKKVMFPSESSSHFHIEAFYMIEY